MNISHIEENSFIYGPGCRFVIWVQGCSIRCKGCWNSEMWDFNLKKDKSTDDLYAMILMNKETIEGVTFLGGEPLDQYAELLILLKKIKQTDLSVMLFTGYEKGEIIQKGYNDIYQYCDIIVSGRYEQKKRTLNHQWIGSTNQDIDFISDRYRNFGIDDRNYIEITIEENGSQHFLGFVNKKIARKLIK